MRATNYIYRILAVAILAMMAIGAMAAAVRFQNDQELAEKRPFTSASLIQSGGYEPFKPPMKTQSGEFSSYGLPGHNPMPDLCRAIEALTKEFKSGTA